MQYSVPVKIFGREVFEHPDYRMKTERREITEIYVPNEERRKEEEDVETTAVFVRKESKKHLLHNLHTQGEEREKSHTNILTLTQKIRIENLAEERESETHT